MERVPLSVVILAKNEAGRIRDCIESVRWAAEVLVVDDESTDATVQIAESLGARVLRRRMDIEGRHRNWAHTQTTYEWILSLDADERVTPELAEEMAGLLRNGAPYDLYAIPRRNYLGMKWIRYGGWYPSAQLKLFKKSVFRWEEAAVHPRALASAAGGTLSGDLLHYSYRDLADFVSKLDRQTTLEADKWVHDGRRITAGKALWRAVDRFFRGWVGKRGYRDGMLGYIVAVMASMYQFLAYAKYWERTRRVVPPASGDVEEVSRVNRSSTQPPGNRLRLSVLLLTKNEEGRLPQCLDTVRWTDEVIVVDGQSTDRTREIARAAGAHVIERPFSGSFAEERNAGLAAATGDWILQMDADETVSATLRAAIERLLAVDSPHAAFKIRRRNYFLGHRMRYGGWYHYNTVLFRRDRCRYDGLVHERLQVRGTTGVLPGDLIHRPFETVSGFVQRQNRYTSLQAQELLHVQRPNRLDWIGRNAVRRPAKIFWKCYVKKAGWRDGMYGAIFSVLFAWVECLKWAKAWEQLEALVAGETPTASQVDPVK